METIFIEWDNKCKLNMNETRGQSAHMHKCVLDKIVKYSIRRIGYICIFSCTEIGILPKLTNMNHGVYVYAAVFLELKIEASGSEQK